jgi:hypothetical protein
MRAGGSENTNIALNGYFQINSANPDRTATIITIAKNNDGTEWVLLEMKGSGITAIVHCKNDRPQDISAGLADSKLFPKTRSSKRVSNFATCIMKAACRDSIER